MYQVCERPRWGIEGCIDSSTVDPAALALHDIALRRVVMLRSSVNANGALPTEDPDRPVPTVVLTTVAPCPSAEQPDPLDCWAVEVEVAVWGPAEPYQVEFQMVALFAAQPCTVTRQLLVGRLAREGADRLYQVAREHVLQSTLYGPWGPLDIGPRDLRSRFCKTGPADIARAIGYWVAKESRGDIQGELESEQIFSGLGIEGAMAEEALALAVLLGFVSYDIEEDVCAPRWVLA